MDYTKNTFETKKIKLFLKEQLALVYFYNSTKGNSRDSKKTKKSLKKVNLLHSKISNQAAEKILRKSIFKNYSELVSNVTLCVTFKNFSDNMILKEKKFDNVLKKDLAFSGIKINNCMYTHSSIFYMNTSFYKKNILKLFEFLKKLNLIIT